jgi:hypothetical protein
MRRSLIHASYRRPLHLENGATSAMILCGYRSTGRLLVGTFPKIRHGPPLINATRRVNTFANTSGGTRENFVTLRACQSRLFTWSDKATPFTGRWSGNETSTGYPFTWLMIGHINARLVFDCSQSVTERALGDVRLAHDRPADPCSYNVSRAPARIGFYASPDFPANRRSRIPLVVKVIAVDPS